MPTNLKDFFYDVRKTFFSWFNILIFKVVNSSYKRCSLFLLPAVSFNSDVTSITVKMI
jgi:hypothetical protein